MGGAGSLGGLGDGAAQGGSASTMAPVQCIRALARRGDVQHPVTEVLSHFTVHSGEVHLEIVRNPTPRGRPGSPKAEKFLGGSHSHFGFLGAFRRALLAERSLHAEEGAGGGAVRRTGLGPE